MTWTPERQPHDRLCECGGEGLLPFKTRDQRGEEYIVWRPCKGTGAWLPDRQPGPEISFADYVDRRPNWYAECATPDWRDREFCRLTGRAIARDPKCVPFPADNPLKPLVDMYAKRNGWIDPAEEVEPELTPIRQEPA